MGNKGVKISIVVAVLAYFVVLPHLWPKPSVRVDYPDQVRIAEDLAITVRTSAWHPFFHVNRIRFYPDITKSSSLEMSDPLYVVQAFGVRPKRFGYKEFFWRFTWPVTRSRQVVVELSEEQVRSKMKPGEIVGKFDVELTYGEYAFRGITTAQMTESIPFRIQVLPEEE